MNLSGHEIEFLCQEISILQNWKILNKQFNSTSFYTHTAAIHLKYSGVIFTEFKLKYDVTTSGKSKSEMLSEPLSPSFPFQLVYTDIYVWVSWDCFNTLIFNILHCIMCHS